MPHLIGQITPYGPLLDVVVAVSGPRQAALQKAGQSVPPPSVVRLLIDTGASQTAVDAAVLTQLQLAPTGSVQIHTPSTNGVPHSCNLFDVALLVPGPVVAVHWLPALAVLEGNFSAQGIGGLMGRDVLASAHMTYSGHSNIFMLSF